MKTLMDINDVIKDSYMSDYKDQYIVLKPEALKAEYRSAKYQLFKAGGGFGCDPSKIGTAVFGTFCADGESTRMERFDFLGIVTPESFEQWQLLYGEPKDENS